MPFTFKVRAVLLLFIFFCVHTPSLVAFFGQDRIYFRMLEINRRFSGNR